MRKKYKRMILGLVCAVSLITQTVTTYACDCLCNCGISHCNHAGDYISEKTYSSTGGTYHNVTWRQICRCSDCYNMTQHNMSATEPCQWTKYEDLGHQGEEGHKYRLTCGLCHGTYDIALSTCPGKFTGKHITPW